MPKLVRLYIRQTLIGFAIAAAFVAGLLALNVVNLRDLILGSSAGYLAGFMLFFANGIVFSGVQFAITIMGMADKDDSGPGTRRPERVALHAHVPIPVEAEPNTPLAQRMARARRR